MSFHLDFLVVSCDTTTSRFKVGGVGVVVVVVKTRNAKKNMIKNRNENRNEKRKKNGAGEVQ